MPHLLTSQVIAAELINYFTSARSAGRECRLLLPGLTSRISGELHEILRGAGVRSYLVVGEGEAPKEDERRISPVGLTSRRVGSFVAVAAPGQLIKIQDSIRGSGGTIRSLAFSEEWPWIDDGPEAFRFAGPFLEDLIACWTSDAASHKWIRDLILDGLVPYTASSTKRSQILLEDMLGSFVSSGDGEEIRERFLFHCGIPRPALPLDEAREIIDESNRLARRIIDRCQKDEGIRDQVIGRGKELRRDVASKISDALNVFLDGIGSESSPDLGPIAFHSCWGNEAARNERWQILDQNTLAAIFDVRDVEKTEISVSDLQVSRGLIAMDDKRWKVATFLGERLVADVTYSIPPARYGEGSWEMQVLNRSSVVIREQLTEHEGRVRLVIESSAVTETPARRLPIRIALAQNGEIDAFARLDLEICGGHRPALIVKDPGFDVFEPQPIGMGDDSIPGLEADEPFHLFVLSANDASVTIEYESDSIDEHPTVDMIRLEGGGFWRTAKPLGVGGKPIGQSLVVCRVGDLEAVLGIEPSKGGQGQFTLEDELRVAVMKSDSRKVDKLLPRFEGPVQEAYAGLGGLDEASRRRSLLASWMTGTDGWRPLLADLRAQGGQQNVGFLGSYIASMGSVDLSSFGKVELPEEARDLVAAYKARRSGIIELIGPSPSASHGIEEHPLYARLPIYRADVAQEREARISKYLSVFSEILEYVADNVDSLGWPQLMVLGYLDIAVEWADEDARNSVFLMGPWHPLVLSKTYMVQLALWRRARRFSDEPGGRRFATLASLLGRRNGFLWFPVLDSTDRRFVPASVNSTDDPMWLFLVKEEDSLEQSRAALRSWAEETSVFYGLAKSLGRSSLERLPTAAISNYVRAFPSRRSLGMAVPSGYPVESVISEVHKLLHNADGPSSIGRSLPGGVRLHIEDAASLDGGTTSRPPAIKVFQSQLGADFPHKGGLDIHMVPPSQSGRVKETTREYLPPRGDDLEAVFYRPLSWLTEGEALLPVSVSYSNQPLESSEPKRSASEFTAALQRSGKLLGKPVVMHSVLDLPQRLVCPWIVVPGGAMDPAVMVKFVRDGSEREVEERTLWDFKFDLSDSSSSYYVLSPVSKAFLSAVNGFFEKGEVASGVIEDLGRIGIAIGSEALLSGRHAFGTIGLAGAVRIVSSSAGIPPRLGKGSIARVTLLIPVDSFASFFGSTSDSDARRTDLLAVQLSWARGEGSLLEISAWGVEAKFVSGTFPRSRANDAIGQAGATLEEFGEFISASLEEGGVPERLALLELLGFGLRVASPADYTQQDAWVELERFLLQSILSRRYRYVGSKENVIVVSTEGSLGGGAELQHLATGYWVRLTKSHWPGIADTESLNRVVIQLQGLLGGEGQGTEEYPSPPEAPRNQGGAEHTERYSAGDQADQEDSRHPTHRSYAAPADAGAGEDRLEAIPIGVDDARRLIYYDPQSSVDPLDNLNIMVTGSSGTGKTQFLKYLICRLREQNKHVFVLDFKNDFASDDYFCKIARLQPVYTSFEGLPYNPLIPYPVQHPATHESFIQPAQHIAAVASVLRSTYGLGAQQEYALKRGITKAFEVHGIPPTGTIPYNPDLTFPDFEQVGRHLEQDNPSAYNRLDPLFTLGLFRAGISGISFEEMVNQAKVVDLSQIPSDHIKNALAQLIVLSAHSYFNTQPQSGTIRQYLFFDEGHRVLDSDFMPRLVRECRAYGVGTVVSTQYPTDFPAEISASMATKVLHGNGSDKDRVKGIANLVGIEEGDVDLAGMDRFEAIVDNRHNRASLIKTISYPIFLVWKYLQERKEVEKAELGAVEGVDTSKLPLLTLVRELEHLGLAEEVGGRIVSLR